MPVYCMHCNACGSEMDVYRSIAEMDNDLPLCCAVVMRRKICAPFVMSDIAPYKSVITGETIDGRSHHRAHLKEHGMVEVGNDKPDMTPREIPDVPGLKEELYARISG